MKVFWIITAILTLSVIGVGALFVFGDANQQEHFLKYAGLASLVFVAINFLWDNYKWTDLKREKEQEKQSKEEAKKDKPRFTFAVKMQTRGTQWPSPVLEVKIINESETKTLAIDYVRLQYQWQNSVVLEDLRVLVRPHPVAWELKFDIAPGKSAIFEFLDSFHPDAAGSTPLDKLRLTIATHQNVIAEFSGEHLKPLLNQMQLAKEQAQSR